MNTSGKKLLTLFAILLVTGCGDPISDADRAVFINYKCTKEEFNQVKDEANFCESNTMYTGTTCTMQAMVRNCQPRAAGVQHAQQ